jgi:two-component system, chemotaxis family, chemotaxis protein CheY
MNVVIADDSGTARMFVRRCFEVAGLWDAKVFEASDGEAVLRLLETVAVQLIITDLNMPVMDGRALLLALKRQNVAIPTIVVTSAANAALVAELKQLGALAVLRKPPTPALALEALRELGIEGGQR